jgi:replicative DNA helicase
MAERTIPYNTDAEQAVLGSILIDPACMSDLHAVLQPTDFYLQKHQWIYGAVGTIHERGEAIDLLTVSAQLEQDGKLEAVGGVAEITHLLTVVPSAISVDSYTRLVLDTADRRRILDGLHQAAQDVYGDKAPHAIVNSLTDLRDQLRTGGNKARTMDVLIDEHSAEVDTWLANPLPKGEVRGISTGLKGIDFLIGGMEPSLIMSGGRPSTGKTTLWLKIAENVAVDHEAEFYTGEMSDRQLLSKMACSNARVSRRELLAGRLTSEEQDRYFEALYRLHSLKLRLIYETNVDRIIASIYKSRPNIAILDYLNIFSGGDGENRNQRFGNIARRLYNLAKELGIPVVLLVQFSRDIESRGAGAIPKMSDMRDSGELEAVTDIALFLFRKPDAPGKLLVHEAKNRLNGIPEGQETIALGFGPHAEVTDLGRSEQEQMARQQTPPAYDRRAF